jgi:hypothetical protein
MAAIVAAARRPPARVVGAPLSRRFAFDRKDACAAAAAPAAAQRT